MSRYIAPPLVTEVPTDDYVHTISTAGQMTAFLTTCGKRRPALGGREISPDDIACPTCLPDRANSMHAVWDLCDRWDRDYNDRIRRPGPRP